MEISTHFHVTESERRRQRIEAQVAYEEAVGRFASLVFKLRETGRLARNLHAIINAIELDPAEPLQSESRVLMLAPDDYKDIQFAAVRELANEIVLARREATEARALATALGCKT